MTKTNTIKRAKWKPTDNRFVAFLDILGFKDLVMRKSHNEIYDQLSAISKTKKLLESWTNNEKILEKCGDAEINIVNFSDSIVVFSKNDDEGNFKYFLMAIRWLFAKTIANGIPLKGGFAHGNVSVNQSEQIYFGQAIIDAYLMEGEVNYFGIVAHNSIEDYIANQIENLDAKFLESALFEIKTPLKSGLINHTNVNWFSKLYTQTDGLNDDEVVELIVSRIKNFKRNTSGSPRKYIDNTLSVLAKLDNTNIVFRKNN